MKINTKTTLSWFGVALLLSNNAFAFSTDSIHEVTCKPPKMVGFTLPEYSATNKVEVPPESAFSFKLSGGTELDKIKLHIKNKPVPFETESNSSFITVKSKIPAEFTGKYARINVILVTELGCIGRDGWLVKVASE